MLLHDEPLLRPFRAEKTPRAWTNADAISQQQHAAREYHRQKRLRRSMAVCKMLDTVKKGKKHYSEQSEPVAEIAVSSNTVPFELPQSAVLGAGRLDPFDAYCQQEVPLYVHEMLDHGKQNPRIPIAG